MSSSISGSRSRAFIAWQIWSSFVCSLHVDLTSLFTIDVTIYLTFFLCSWLSKSLILNRVGPRKREVWFFGLSYACLDYQFRSEKTSNRFISFGNRLWYSSNHRISDLNKFQLIEIASELNGCNIIFILYLKNKIYGWCSQVELDLRLRVTTVLIVRLWSLSRRALFPNLCHVFSSNKF